MESKVINKIPNGKLLKINLKYDDLSNKIIDIKISGDFFIHPEESIDIIEEYLKNVKLSEKNLKNKIESIIKEKSMEIIGFSSDDLVKTILMCKS